MSTSLPPDFNERVIEEFRANSGRVGGIFEGMPLLLLHTTGAKSGKGRIHPLVYHGEDGRFVIFASKGGAPTNPDWYHNLKAHPDASVEVASETLEVTAAEATGEERERLFSAQVERAPQFGDYASQTERTIPVIVLTPRREE